MTARAAKLHRRLPSADQVLGRPGRVVLVAVALVLLGSLSAPDNAQAIDLPGLPGLPGLPSLNPADWAIDALKAILKFIFGDELEDLARHLIKLLLASRCSPTPRSSPA